jgi:hypothetical protein
LIHQRINSCHIFYREECSHQNVMARVYLVPQILNGAKIREAQRTCFDCRKYVDRLVRPSAPSPGYFLLEMRYDL